MTAKLKNSIEVLENKVEENSQGVKQIGKMTDGKIREKNIIILENKTRRSTI